MKRILSALCVFFVLLIVATSSVSADQAPASSETVLLLGDVDADGEVTVIDATAIQRYLSDLLSENQIQISVADADGDGDITILDATEIQRWLAGLPANEHIDKPIESSIEEQIKNYTPQKGIDISSHNGDVDMEKIKAAGFTFVMIRLGYGDDLVNQDDTWFERNVKKAEAAGLDWGAYLYSYALTPDEAQSEIAHTLRLLKDKRPTMPIAFDIENDNYKVKYGMPSDETLQQICITYLNGIKSAGYYPILYANLNWLSTKLNNSLLLNNYDLWVAQWSTKLSYSSDNVGIWQYGGETNYIDTPQIDGISGVFDKNYCYKNYPVIITAFGYNNHPGLLTQTASTSASPQNVNYTPKPVPDGFDGVMGDSLR